MNSQVNQLAFERYIGIDYSGAETAESSLKGLRIYCAGPSAPPYEIAPASSPRKNWTRRGIAEWLVESLYGGPPALVGIDHGFSFPLPYFERNGVPTDWATFLEDFQRHWPTDEKSTYVDFVRDGVCGNSTARSGNRRWRRLTEVRAGGAKSVFHFDVPGSVAKSTHAGLPWLLYIRKHLGDQIHFWPFDGWHVPEGRSVIAEVYPSLWSKEYPTEGRDSHQNDAYSIAAWMRRADGDGSLPTFFEPYLEPTEKHQARIEGWILGVA